MKFGEVLDRIERPLGEEVLYIKDWHLALADEEFYEPPELMKDDWMNEYYLNRENGEGKTRDDFRFVYIGEKDSFTGLHKDVCEYLNS